jgi:hypothetical protein
MQLLSKMLKDVQVLSVDEAVARKFGDVRAWQLDNGLGSPELDLLNGAVALVHDSFRVRGRCGFIVSRAMRSTRPALAITRILADAPLYCFLYRALHVRTCSVEKASHKEEKNHENAKFESTRIANSGEKCGPSFVFRDFVFRAFVIPLIAESGFLRSTSGPVVAPSSARRNLAETAS